MDNSDVEPPRFTNWQEAWEWHARETRDFYATQDADALLAQIRAGHYDEYYTIWYAVAEKSTLAEAAPVLLDVLRREAGQAQMLVRYHCAAALFRLLGHPTQSSPPLRERVQWDHLGEDARQAAIEELAAQIAETPQ